MKKLCLVFLLAALLAGCAPAQDTPQVAATTLPVYEFTVLLCQGTDITVARLVTESISCLHDYTLQVSQMRTMEAAQVIVISGAGLEDFLEDALSGAENTIDASSGIALLDEEAEDDSGEGHAHETDPHIWLSPENAKQMAKNICAGLSEEFPAYSDIFQTNLDVLLSQLDVLQAYGEAALGNLKCRDLVTFHDGFAYFAQAFDLTIAKAIEEESGSEASAAELAEIIGIVNDLALPAVFTEANGSTAAAQVISEETGAKIFSLDMAIAGDDYFAAMYHNIDTIREAYQ